MRDRLVIVFIALAVGIVALYGVPRALMIPDLVHATETQRVQRATDLFSALIAEHERTGPVTAEFLEPLLQEQERISYAAADGTVLDAGIPAHSDDISATVEVPGGGEVTFARSDALIDSRVQNALQPVIWLGLLTIVVAAAAAVLLARRMSRPFVQLAETAKAIGSGQAGPEPEDLKIPEARAIDAALRESAATLETRIRREHEFAANASHQLRTPITAVRLELEDLSLWPQTPPAVREQLDHAVKEIDRLADAIAQLLEMARGDVPGTGTSSPLDVTIAAAVERWSAPARDAGRSIRLSGVGPSLGAVPAAASQILDVLLHNALVHGRGDITISGTRRAEYVTVQVADEGPRPKGNSVFQRRPEQRSATSGEGIGLALSAELAESLGGHLLLEGDATTTFSLILPSPAASQPPSVP
ncbi:MULTISPECIES: sensor histidine kinase KdpD [unclassified Microbacterium]|uniref:sensor histidine kinase n=1 Tax=unclassified Microbacterium TaxID=2609290 RepID=UPI0012FBE4A0|nr:HAMP domain-containing sensor histidine kinase [Microbacterium sp. MAH-37]MVQ43867.1 HAMP domain-containing protein [Microbacterium sp. MAH-37]